MSKVNLVCFNCRISKRVDIQNEKYSEKCSTCNGKLENLGYKTRLPKNSEIKKWKEFENQYRHEKISQEQENFKDKVRIERELRQEIEKLEEREENKERQRQINELQKRLQKLRNQN
jgi:hypothetical protein